MKHATVRCRLHLPSPDEPNNGRGCSLMRRDIVGQFPGDICGESLGNILDVSWCRSRLLCNSHEADGSGNVAHSSRFSQTKSIWRVMVKFSNHHDSLTDFFHKSVLEWLSGRTAAEQEVAVRTARCATVEPEHQEASPRKPSPPHASHSQPPPTAMTKLFSSLPRFAVPDEKISGTVPDSERKRTHPPSPLNASRLPLRCIHGNQRGQASWACASPDSGD
ncbi:unnamed protein product [Pleuronectes platessa]|uniref:Uncharacterized protein n=1 Tax=Pleuronectes platessa TaxID=8262 RepID=A0A9N7V1Q6_PLEPL|nr:unnamed protein product [Pleuronectes platessa]